MMSIRVYFALLTFFVAANSQLASAATCPYPKTITFAGVNWESGMFMTEVLRYMMEKGYGCQTDTIPGNTVAMENALRRNDIQVTSEQWAGRSPIWRDAEKKGEVFSIGETVKGATEGWWVPEYVVKGDPARGIKPVAPNLKSVTDLVRYKEVFRDAEETSKGRFYNCPIGWTCEIVNSQKLKAYGLNESYVNFRTGTGPALDAAINSAVRRGEPVLFYYWSPTPLMGHLKLIQLEEPPYSEEAWATLANPNNPNPIGSASLPAKITVGVSRDFHERAPQLVQMLEKVELPLAFYNQLLANMADSRKDVAEVRTDFLKQHPGIWTQWVPADVKTQIEASLK
ncbi:ABC transporter substrate-binding protein [Pseudomonas aeruginosa]|uniref:ABC transporter substrate-binding protein n=1 Tax=Pseudomonas aeruginosa TaxID=287 RepID=UPI003F751CD6